MQVPDAKEDAKPSTLSVARVPTPLAPPSQGGGRLRCRVTVFLSIATKNRGMSRLRRNQSSRSLMNRLLRHLALQSVCNLLQRLPPLINACQLRLELRQPSVGLGDRRAVAFVKCGVGHRLVQLLNLRFEGLDARGQRF
jgi:hypothetical protein